MHAASRRSSAHADRPRVVAGLRLETLVGQGGEGEVWEAHDATGARRALKLIRPDSLVAAVEVGRRGRWLLRIDHPALVSVRRTGALRGGGLDGWGFVEMDFVDGASLQDASADPGALERLAGLADALDALHAGVWSDGVPLVHRDVKPANLIATPAGRLVLVDHSTLRALEGATITRIGTPVFVAPEVMSGRVGPAADVYSFAVTALALLTGARGGELADLAAEPDLLDVPEGLRAAMATDPADRPTSCVAVLDPDTPLILADQLEDTDQWTGTVGPGGGPGTVGRADWTTADVGWLAGQREAPLPAPPGPDEPAEVAWAADVAPPVEQRVAWPPPDRGDGYGAPLLAPLARPTVGRWLLAYLVVVVPAGWAVLTGARGLATERIAVLGAAVALHLVVHVVARRSLVAAVVVPPVAWALLLADKASAVPGRLRDWARPLLTGAVAVTAVPLAVRPLDEWGALRLDELGAPEALAAAVLGLLLTLLAVAAVRSGGLLVRLVLAPVWALGAAILLAGGLALFPFAVLAGRGRALGRVLVGIITGMAAFLAPARPFA
ncbi:hypothetical protein BH20ACT8_BH20ACT8_04920 [soil metagenome]